MMIKLLITKEEEKKLEALSPSAVKFHEFLKTMAIRSHPQQIAIL
jgi:hypothetical protein